MDRETLILEAPAGFDPRALSWLERSHNYLELMKVWTRDATPGEFLKNHPHPLTNPLNFQKPFEGFNHAGLSLRVKYTEPTLNFLHMEAEIFEEEEKVGECAYQLSIDESEELSLNLAHFHFEPEYQGRGFSKALNRRVEKAAKRYGIAAMTIHPVATGAYAWASQGFEFDPRGPRLMGGSDKEFISSLSAEQAIKYSIIQATFHRWYHVEESISKGFISRSLAEELESKVADLDDPFEPHHLQTPHDIAKFGKEYKWSEKDRDNGTEIEMWLGKKLMLNHDWSGIKFF